MQVKLERDAAGGFATLTIDHPGKKNALTVDMRRQMEEHLYATMADDGVRALILTGAAGMFCAGVDVDHLKQRGITGARARYRDAVLPFVRALARFDKPVIAAVAGPAVGIGWSLALASDIVIAGSSARFGSPFARIGLAPDGGLVYLLTRRAGLTLAKELVFSGRTITAEEAFQARLVNQVVDDAVLLDTARKMAADFAAGATFAYQLTKRLFRVSDAATLDEFLEAELLIQPQLMESEDHQEGLAAFKSRRRPDFKGR